MLLFAEWRLWISPKPETNGALQLTPESLVQSQQKMGTGSERGRKRGKRHLSWILLRMYTQPASSQSPCPRRTGQQQPQTKQNHRAGRWHRTQLRPEGRPQLIPLRAGGTRPRHRSAATVTRCHESGSRLGWTAGPPPAPSCDAAGSATPGAAQSPGSRPAPHPSVAAWDDTVWLLPTASRSIQLTRVANLFAKSARCYLVSATAPY